MAEALWVGRMNQTLLCGWLPGQVGMVLCLACSRLSAMSSQKHFLKNLFSQDPWILGLFFSCKFLELDSRSFRKDGKKELGQYLPILTLTVNMNVYAGSKKDSRLIRVSQQLLFSLPECQVRNTFIPPKSLRNNLTFLYHSRKKMPFSLQIFWEPFILF